MPISDLKNESDEPSIESLEGKFYKSDESDEFDEFDKFDDDKSPFTKEERKIIKEKLPENFPIPYIKKLKIGEDVQDELTGKIYRAEDFTMPANSGKSYTYCSDTMYNELKINALRNIDVLYHEATFTEEHKKRATETCHSTAKQAATIAQKANVKKLIIGHYSSRYKELETHLAEAKSVFENTVLGEEGGVYLI